MLSEKETVRISKFLSLVLRHQPEKIGLTLDDNGWTDVDVLLEKLAATEIPLSRETLNHIVATNPKKRFAFNNASDKIRACQGHSIEVNLGYTPQQPPEILYHGTAINNLESITKYGLEKRSRTHVHLSATTDTAINVGSRHGKPFVLEVLAAKMHNDGYHFFLSENGVWLTDSVPPEYLLPNQ